MPSRRSGFRSPRLDPKPVRDYFYKYALFTRVFTLASDGLWWLICRGWLTLARRLGGWWRWLWPWRLPVDEALRRQHSFVVGRTGSGKSVLLHHHLRHYLTKNTGPTVVLLDPHGDLALSVARDRALWRTDRLVYLDLNGLRGRMVRLNPFALAARDEVSLNRAQLQFAGALEQIIGEPFSPRQRTLVRASLAVVLHAPNLSLLDLLRLWQDGPNADLLRYGQTQLPNPVDRQFFSQSWADPLYRSSKLALASRLTDVVRDPVVRRFACAGQSFDLGAILTTGKVVVVRFDPARQGRDTMRTIGQLLTAAITSQVLGRPLKQRHPIHLFIDEAQYFCSPALAEILGETRKFGLYLTLATQRLDSLDNALQDALLGNVGNLWVGGSRAATAERLARDTDIPADTIRRLGNLAFMHAVNGREPQTYRLPYLGGPYRLRPAQWADTKRQQAARYYQPTPAHRPGNVRPTPSQPVSFAPTVFSLPRP